MNAGKLTPAELRAVRAKLPLGPGVLALNAPAQTELTEEEQNRRLGLMGEHRRLQIRPTTDEAKLNKTEKAYLEWLQGQQNTWIGVQCITLKIGHDCRYTPDFWALDRDGLRAIDTKGAHTWEDSLIKIRVVARIFPFIRFLIAKRDGEVWEHTEIKP